MPGGARGTIMAIRGWLSRGEFVLQHLALATMASPPGEAYDDRH